MLRWAPLLRNKHGEGSNPSIGRFNLSYLVVGLDLTAMASATTQPISDHPKSRLMTMTEPVLGTCRVIATIVGTK